MTQVAPPILSVNPARALVDEKFEVLVENLPPGCPVTVRSLHHSEDKDYWEAYGHYVSDHRGIVSVAEDFSFGGTYTGNEPRGLLWSVRPVPGSRADLRLRKMNVCTPMLFNISVHSGHEGFRDQPPLASVLTERWCMAPGVQRIDIREQGVQGTLFLPPGPGPFPGLLDMWGGGEGRLEYRAALLASHGYVSLALDYLGSGNVDLHCAETAFNIIKDHPQVMPNRVGIFGLSLCSVLAFSLAAYTTVKPRCIVCVSSNNYCPPGKMISEVTEAVLKQFGKQKLDENSHMKWRDFTIELITDNSNNLEAEKMNCPTLLVNDCDDQNWPSVEAAEDVARLMCAAGKEHLLTKVAYPDTGHLIEPPFSPHFSVSNFIILHTQNKAVIMKWGGQTKPRLYAQEDSWRKTLSFLQLHLYCNLGLKAKM